MAHDIFLSIPKRVREISKDFKMLNHGIPSVAIES